MKIKDLDKIKNWVYAQIDQWAEDNCNSAADLAWNEKEVKSIKKDIELFKKKKKEEFDKLLESKK